jgi:hypothetical protein
MYLSAQPIFNNDNILTQYGEFGKNVDINVYVYSIPKYTTPRWYRGNTTVSSSTLHIILYVFQLNQYLQMITD